MYTTRRLSEFINNPDYLSSLPDGPNSGYLVVQDVEAETYSCFGLCKNNYPNRLPFPQNKKLAIQFPIGNGSTIIDEVVLVPVINQPLSSNQYYAIQPRGSHKGEAYTCSREEDMTTCCFCRHIRDIKPRPLDPQNAYQQYKIAPVEGCCGSISGTFTANSIAPDGFPPSFLRRHGWYIYTRTSKSYKLDEALGIDAALRSRLPEFSIPVSSRSSKSVVVGKWYSPFMFIKEGSLADQVKTSLFYEITLERKWEQIFSTENNFGNANSVFVDVPVQKEAVFIDGREAIWDDKNIVDGTIWFTSVEGNGGEQTSVGLRTEIVERMRWEEEKVGWIGGAKRQVRVERVENYGGIGGWTRFGCYMLVESFVLKRINGSLVMTYDFRHMNEIQSRWE